MKARLGELQARLDSHERRHLQHPPLGHGDPTRGFVPPLHININPLAGAGAGGRVLDRRPPGVGTCGLESSPSPGTDGGPVSMPLVPPAMYRDQPLDDAGDPAPYHHSTRFLDSPPHSQASPPHGANSLLSPPGQSGADGHAANLSPGFSVDCMRLQTQLLDRLDHLQQDLGYVCPSRYATTETMGSSRRPPLPPPLSSWYQARLGPAETAQQRLTGAGLDALGQPELVPCMDGFTGSADGLRYAFDCKADGGDARMWERRGPDDLLAATESTLAAERAGPGGNTLLAHVLPLLETPDGGLPLGATEEALAGVRKAVQSEVRPPFPFPFSLPPCRVAVTRRV